jgi:hypothetical protein
MELKISGAVILADGPPHGEWIERNATSFNNGEPVRPQAKIKLFRGNKFSPIMCSARQPAQDVFRSNDCLDEGADGAIERTNHQDAAWCDQARECLKESRNISDVLYHLQRQNGVEGAAFFGDFLRQCVPVLNGSSSRARVPRGHRDIPLRGVDAKHRGAKIRHRLSDKPGTTADIEDIQARQRSNGAWITLEQDRQALG